MKIVKNLAFAVMAIFAVNIIAPQLANAAPESTTAQTKKVQKKPVVKSKKNYKKKKSVKQKQLAPPHVVVDNRAECFARAGDSPSAFFSCDRVTSVNVATVNTFTPSKKSSSVFGGNNIIQEAKKLDGMTVKNNRVALKNYMNTNKNPIDPLRTPWCAAFANAVLRRTGHEGTDSHMARSFLNYGIKTVKPSEGDIVVLKRGRSRLTGHVGFFKGYEWHGSKLYVKVVGGNQNKSVNVAHFPVEKVLGYRIPV